MRPELLLRVVGFTHKLKSLTNLYLAVRKKADSKQPPNLKLLTTIHLALYPSGILNPIWIPASNCNDNACER